MASSSPAVGAAPAPAATAAPIVGPTAQQLAAEVEEKLRESLPKLTPWQRRVADAQLAAEPSKLHAKLVAYQRNVADVESYAAATVTAPIAALTISGEEAPADEEEPSTPTADASSEPSVKVIAPTLTHPNFHACLIDSMLTLLGDEWERLFSACSTADGKRISKTERNAKGWNKSSLVYGEITFKSFGEVFWNEKHVSEGLKPGGTFVDLGQRWENESGSADLRIAA
jgi:hypothetical protein